MFVLLSVLLVIMIFFHLHRKKKNYFIKKGIKKSLELWISKFLLDEDENKTTHLQIPLKFKKHFRNAAKREYAIELLINLKKNLSGKVADNIITLYNQTGFKKDSIHKFKSLAWQKKAKGIYELYVMNQKDMLLKIYKLTNHHDERIRTEAQTAVIEFYGFEGLRFLHVLSYPLTEWEQIKLLEQLKHFGYGKINSIGRWLRSANSSVVVFALRLAEAYQQSQVYEEVVKCLEHKNERVRIQAVLTLTKIARDNTASILTKYYYSEGFRNKQNILNCLANLATNRERTFLEMQLNEENDFLKLVAARSLIKCCDKGFDIIEEKAQLQPFPYKDIYLHLRSELKNEVAEFNI